MAKPRVFVSSTYYDLKHVRSSLDNFIESLGYESVLSEKGAIAYTADRPLDESCYREAGNADIFVLIVGGRYGSEASGENNKKPKTFFDRYDSITKKEYESAISRDVPIYILIESGVYSEYQTFLKNKDNKVQYAHVDSVNIFHLIEAILAQPRNNPVHSFDRFSDIESWLRDQWAGVFREMLQKQSQQQQLLALTTEIGQLKQVNETLKTYLEAVMKGISKDQSTKLIQSEEKRLDEANRMQLLVSNGWVRYMTRTLEVQFDDTVSVLKKAKSFKEFAALAGLKSKLAEAERRILNTLTEHEAARKDFNECRRLLGLPSLRMPRQSRPKKAETASGAAGG